MPQRRFTTPAPARRSTRFAVKPSGGLAAGPLHRDKSLLIAELDLDLARRARKPLDVAGHYGRPDLFHLRVDRRPQTPVSFDDQDG